MLLVVWFEGLLYDCLVGEVEVIMLQPLSGVELATSQGQDIVD